MNTRLTESRPVSPAASVEALAAHGVWAPPVSPVGDDLSPDLSRWTAHLQWLLANGCHGLALFGTTSEANSFSMEERMWMLEAALAAGIDPDRIMVGTGLCSIAETVRLTRHSLDRGCHNVLMLPPFYYKGVSDDGLFAHFSRVIEDVADDRLRVFLYHFPKMSAVALSVALVGRLRERYGDVVAGLKDSSGDWENTEALLDSYPGMAIFPGSESLLLQGLRHGGAGCITASANANPAVIRAVFDAWREETAEADKLHEKIDSIRAVFNQFPLVSALKAVLAHHHRDPAWRRVRPPMVALGEEDAKRLVEQLEERGYQFP